MSSVEENKQSNIISNPFQTGLLCLGIILCIFIASVDETIVATVLKSITDDFGASDQATWIASSYLLTTTAFTPLYGRFSDIFGRRPAIVFSLAIFLIGSIFCGTASNIITLIVFRGLSGIGAGGLIALSFIIISDSVKLESRGLYFSLVSTTAAISHTAGPILGGLFADTIGWRWVFYINIPLSIITLVVVIFFVPLVKGQGSIRSKIYRVDFGGTITLVSGVILIELGMSWGGHTYPWLSIPVISTIFIGVFLLIIFAIIEDRYAKEPIIPRRVFNRNVTLANITSLSMGIPMFVFIYHWSGYFQMVRRSTATHAGAELLPMVLGVCIFSALGGAIVNYTGKYLPLKWAGMIILVAGLCLLSRLSLEMTRWEEILYPLMVGMGIGVNFPTNNIVVQASVLTEDVAVATAVIYFTFTMGGIIGLTIQGAIFNNILVNSMSEVIPNIDAIMTTTQLYSLSEPLLSAAIQVYIKAYRIMFLSLVPFATIGLIAVFFIKPTPLKN